MESSCIAATGWPAIANAHGCQPVAAIHELSIVPLGFYWHPGQRGHRKVGISAAVEGLHPNIGRQVRTERRLDGSVDGSERTLARGILRERRRNLSVDGMDLTGAADLFHLDAVIHIAQIEIAGSVLHANVAAVYGAQPQESRGGHLQLEVVCH